MRKSELKVIYEAKKNYFYDFTFSVVFLHMFPCLFVDFGMYFFMHLRIDIQVLCDAGWDISRDLARDIFFIFNYFYEFCWFMLTGLAASWI